MLASLALFVCSNAVAGSMAATPITIDTATAPDVITLPDISVTLGNYLRYGDDVLVKVAGATTVAVSAGDLPGLVSCVGYATTPIGYVTTGADSWIFRAADVGELASGLTCTFHGLRIAKSSLGGGCQVTASYEARAGYSGLTIDSAGPVTVANVSPCGPPPPTIVAIRPSSARSAMDDFVQDGVFDTWLEHLAVVNDGLMNVATAFEFDLSGVPAGAQIEMAVLGVLVGTVEGLRQVAVSAFPGDGTVSLPDFAAGTLVEQRTVETTAPYLAVDVTSVVNGWLADQVPFGGFNLREVPANPPMPLLPIPVLDSSDPPAPALLVAYRAVPRIGIDVRPGTEPNNVNLRSKGNVPVAILSGATLYAPTDVVVESLHFGRDGTEASLLRCSGMPEDVNLDGLLDLVCYFSTQAAAFQPGDAEAVLTVETTDGVKREGRDSIRIVP